MLQKGEIHFTNYFIEKKKAEWESNPKPSSLEVNFNVMRSINSRFTYLLTYFLQALPLTIPQNFSTSAM